MIEFLGRAPKDRLALDEGAEISRKTAGDPLQEFQALQLMVSGGIRKIPPDIRAAVDWAEEMQVKMGK